MAKKIINIEKFTKRSFEDAVFSAVDSALKEFGESTSEAMYFYLARVHSITKPEIPRRFDEFVLAVRNDFGVGAKTLEALILEKLYEKLGPNSEEFQRLTAKIIILSAKTENNVEPTVPK